VTEETAAVARGPKPNPLARYRRANAKADKIRAAIAKQDALTEALAEAEAEEQAAYAALQESLAGIQAPPGLIAGGIEER